MCRAWKQIYEKIKKEDCRKIEISRKSCFGFLVTVIFATMITTAMMISSEQQERVRLQQHLAGEVLRFHVLANSDSTADQELKFQVRDAVLAYLEAELPQEDQNSTDVQKTTEWVRKHTDTIRRVSEETLAEARSDQTVSVAVTTCYFPDKTYGDITFPAGNYEALRIELGESRGHNWWCVLYPNLCFLDTTEAVVPESGKKQLKAVLTEEEYSRVTATSEFEIDWFFWKGK